MPAATDDFIRVINPVTLGVDRLSAERIPVGIPGDYKPCIARLPSGELLLVYFHQVQLEGGKIREDMFLHRSMDGGKRWSAREMVGLLGREPYFTVLEDGTIFISVHLLTQDIRNKEGYTHSYLHRSTDSGHTWTTIHIGVEDLPGAAPRSMVGTSRNVLELDDGTLVFGVGAPKRVNYLWRSYDRGKTWDRSLACEFEGCEFEGVDKKRLWWGLFPETMFWRGQGSKILGIFRVDPKVFPPLPGTKAPTNVSDQFDRMIVYESTDGGKTWGNRKDLGDYGEMYPAILRLLDGRLMLTFTVRSIKPPLGVKAVLGYEDKDGVHFDFNHDRLVISAKTPVGMPSGGGFGPTVQLDDGTLITAYSYRGTGNKFHVEVVRWRLPKPKKQ